VTGDPVLQGVQLVSRWQFAIDEQVGDLEEGRLLSELLDGYPRYTRSPASPSMKVMADLQEAVFMKPGSTFTSRSA